MNGQQIINAVITYSTPELDEAKDKMATLLDKMFAHVPTLKSQEMDNFEICANADTMIRQQGRKIFQRDYVVEREGQKAIMGIGQETFNAIVDKFEWYARKIGRASCRERV